MSSNDGHSVQPPAITAPLLVWLLIQLAALLISALQIPLSARFPRPAERLALEEMIVVQIAVSSLAFPFLLRDRWAAAGAIGSAVVFQQIAALLAAVEPLTALLTGAFVACWLAALALWNDAIDSARGRLAATAAAGAFSLGGPLLWYLAAEFTRNGFSLHWRVQGLLGPIMGSLALIHARRPVWFPWAIVGVLLVAGGVAAGIVRRRHCRTLPTA